MASITKDWFDSLTFELNTEQIYAVNKLLGDSQFRFVPLNEASKNLKKLKDKAQLYGPPKKGGKISTETKTPHENSPGLSDNSPVQHQVAPKPENKQPASEDPKEAIRNLFTKLSKIVRSDFPQISSSFDFEILERGISRGYFINVDEFRVAAKQVIRATARKYKNLKFDYLMKFQEMPPPPKIAHPTHTQPRANIKPNMELSKKIDNDDDDNSGSLFDSNEVSKDSESISQNKDKPIKRRKITEDDKVEHLLPNSNSNSQQQVNQIKPREELKQPAQDPHKGQNMDTDMARLESLDIPKVGRQPDNHKDHPMETDQEQKPQTDANQQARDPEKPVRVPEDMRIPPSQPHVNPHLTEAPLRDAPSSQPIRAPQASPIHEIETAKKSKHVAPDVIRPDNDVNMDKNMFEK